MKSKSYLAFIALALLAVSTPNLQLSNCFAQGTAFSYSGQLQNSGSPANGSYDLTFALFNTNNTGVAVAGPLTFSATAVSNGLFIVSLDFGGVFTGTSYWLEIGVRTNGDGAFTTLAPRQELTPAPYAIFDEGASNLVGALPAAQLTGTLPLAQLPVEVVTNTETDVTLGNLTPELLT